MKMNDKRKFVVAPKNRAPRSGRQNLIELIIKCKLNETQGQDWGVTLTKN
jgi:hypothetical protein